MTSPACPAEIYRLENDRYVLYLGTSPVLVTDVVAVLVDLRLPMLITHGDPNSVRRELDEMREVLRASRAPRYEKDWLLLEGRPDLDWLNRAIACPADLIGIDLAFKHREEASARDITRSLLERIARRDARG